jgi:hypothetical protein
VAREGDGTSAFGGGRPDQDMALCHSDFWTVGPLGRNGRPDPASAVADSDRGCDGALVKSPRVRVLLGRPQDTPADIVVLAGSTEAHHGRTVTLGAPRWRMPNGPEYVLANTYRQAVAMANERRARSMALPAILAVGPWPLEVVTRVALTVFMSTPTTLQEILVVVRTPEMLEQWAEALIRTPWNGPTATGRWY